MPFDVPQAEPALSRRSRRVAVVPAVSEAPMTRRERRTRDSPASIPPVPPAESVLAEGLPVVFDAVVAPAERMSRRHSRAAESAHSRPAASPVTASADEPVFAASAASAAEPVTDEASEKPAVTDETVVADEPVDLFAEAARALNFTGETPVVATQPGTRARGSERTAHVAPRRSSAIRRVATIAASVGAFGIVGLLAVGMTTPLSALASTSSDDIAGRVVGSAQSAALEKAHEEIQAFVAPADAKNAVIAGSSGYEAATFAEIAAVTGINTANAVYVNDPTADIQWPIVLGVGTSYGFGSRWGQLHEGIDFTPGAGAPVQAIAEGTVRIGPYGAYGNNVYIDHVFDGVKITSHYAHMQDGSIQVVNGQHVKVGDIIGKVGNTGRSFGAHLHFELRDASGKAFDPMPWMNEHAGTHYKKSADDTGDSDDSDVQVASVE